MEFMEFQCHYSGKLVKNSYLKEDNCILKVLMRCYEAGHLPSYLEPDRNLVFKMAQSGQLKDARIVVKRVYCNLIEILHMLRIKREDIDRDIESVRSALFYLPTDMFPYVSKTAAVDALKGLNKDFYTQDGCQRYYFETDKFVTVRIMDKAKEVMVNEETALKLFLSEAIHSILVYLDKDRNKELSRISYDEESLTPWVHSFLIESDDVFKESFLWNFMNTVANWSTKYSEAVQKD